MDSIEGVSLPLIHKHLLVPSNDLGKGDCCGRFEALTDGFYCERCDFFIHKKCGDEASESIQHPSHSKHPLQLQSLQLQSKQGHLCNLCNKEIMDLCYRCDICDFDIDLHCAKCPPPKVINVSETHHHKLTLLERQIMYDCNANCGKIGYGFPYECQECDLTFHVDCVWNQLEVERSLEVNHSYHSLHPLKLFTGQPPKYSDGKCRLCGRKVDKKFYHCSLCNFTLDMRCVLHPPPQSLMDVKVHGHKLTLLPRLISFTCNACGLKGDRSPYVCVECDFLIHKDCLGLPRVININRHDHRISHISLIGLVNSICGVCRKKVDWTCGGFSCLKCPGYIVHSKCATRKDVWNGKELEEVPEEIEDIEPYVVIDDNTIQHFSHKEHYLRLNVDSFLWEEKKRCNACTHPIRLQSFYDCKDCEFSLHQNCAEATRRKWHVLHNEQLTLSNDVEGFICVACRRMSNGFMYKHGYKKLDVQCGSISEPVVHPSHSQHPLYYIPRNQKEFCNGCNCKETQVLRCIEDGCEFALCFKCVILPLVVKHRVDDHPLSLRYGEKASGKYWCDICEKETSPTKWFYTCKDHRASLHTECVLGEELAALMPRSTIEAWNKSYEMVLNDSITRPFCRGCESRCVHPIIMKLLGTSNIYFCRFLCIRTFGNKNGWWI